MVHLSSIFALVQTIIAMERIQLEPGYIQLFPRTFEHGLHPLHVEKSDFVAECRYVEGYGDAWLLHQQKPPHLVARLHLQESCWKSSDTRTLRITISATGR